MSARAFALPGPLRRLLLYGGVMWGLGCGGPEAAVFVRIEAPLRVPEQCDAVRLVVSRVADGAQVFERTDDLAAGPTPFPLELTLTTSNTANLGAEAVRLTVEALLGGEPAAPWARAEAPLDLQEGRITQARIVLCDCPAE